MPTQHPLNQSSTIVPAQYTQQSEQSTCALPEGIPTGLRFVISEGAGGVYEFPLTFPIIIGRNSSQGMVTLDLSSYNAQDLGISRQHVKIEVYGERVMVVDLGSANGTRLNNEILTPKNFYQLNHGDELKLGRVKMRVYFNFI